MAGFLRKKPKQPPSGGTLKKAPPAAPASASAAPPPLFARFATTASSTSDSSGNGGRAVVSGPMALSSGSRRGEQRRGYNSSTEQFAQQQPYPQSPPQQQRAPSFDNYDKPLPAPVPVPQPAERGRPAAPSSYHPVPASVSPQQHRPPSAQGNYTQQRPPSAQGNYARPPSAQGNYNQQRSPSAQGNYNQQQRPPSIQNGNGYPQRATSVSAYPQQQQQQYQVQQNQQRPPGRYPSSPPQPSHPQNYAQPTSSSPPKPFSSSPPKPSSTSPPPPPPSKSPAPGAGAGQRPPSILRDPNPPPNLALFESSRSVVRRASQVQVGVQQGVGEVGQREYGGAQRGQGQQHQERQQYNQLQQQPPQQYNQQPRHRQSQQFQQPQQSYQQSPPQQYQKPPPQQYQSPSPPQQQYQPPPPPQKQQQHHNHLQKPHPQHQQHSQHSQHPQQYPQQQAQQAQQRGRPLSQAPLPPPPPAGSSSRPATKYYDDEGVVLPDEVALFQWGVRGGGGGALGLCGLSIIRGVDGQFGHEEAGQGSGACGCGSFRGAWDIVVRGVWGELVVLRGKSQDRAAARQSARGVAFVAVRRASDDHLLLTVAWGLTLAAVVGLGCGVVCSGALILRLVAFHRRERGACRGSAGAGEGEGDEYTQTIPTPPDSLGINFRQTQPLPVEKDNIYNKGTPDGSSGNLGKEEHTASGSILATSSPSDTAEMGGAYSRMTRRSPELQRKDTSSMSSSQSQQQQPQRQMQQTGRRQPVVVPPQAPAPVTNYSVPLRAPVAVSSRSSPLVNSTPNANHVIRQQPATYEVEPGFPTPSPPPSIPLPPASSPPPPSFQPLQPAFGTPTKSPSMRSVNTMPMATRGKPLIFAAMANVDDEPQMQQRPQVQERRANGVTSPKVQGRALPPGAGAAQPNPPVEFASPRMSTTETVMKNRPISGMSSSPPKASGPRVIPPPSKARTPSPPAVNAMHSPRMHGPRQLPPSSPPQNPRVRKQSKTNARGGAAGAEINRNGTSEGAAGPSSTSSLSISPSFYNDLPRLPPKSATSSVAVDPSAHVDEETARKAGLPLDDDPFAKAEGVKMLPPSSPPASRDGHPSPSKRFRKMDGSIDDSRSVKTHESRPSTANRESDPSLESETRPRDRKESKEATKEANGSKTAASASPDSPDDTRSTRKMRVKAEKLAAAAAAARPQSDLPFPKDKSEDRPPSRMGQFSLTQFLADPHLLSTLLSFLSFYEWLVLSSVSREIRIQLVQTTELREEALERYLRTVGYARWAWDDAEPISLSLQDLADYMRGVSTPTHEYARIAAMYVQSLTVHPNLRDPEVNDIVRSYTAATRAYTRVVLRLRAQCEREQQVLHQRGNTTPPSGRATSLVRNGYTSPSRMGASRTSSRAPSPTQSSFSHGHPMSPGGVQLAQSQRAFQSPLFRYRRAPLLRVFVPSPEGDWLSDKSVLECEAECKRAGVLHLLRIGDVVWDVAVSDEGNVGRLVWDGSYLIDLDYTYSRTGDLPKYLPALAFPPSYFHRVIRTGAIASNPIVHIDISPWGAEVAANLQLLQDRVKTETPQGTIHNVVRWVHRSTFVIRPPPPRPRLPPPRIQLPESDMFVDSGWYGTIVVETEGTNEALADLQERCGPGAFPPRVRPVAARLNQAQIEARKIWRIMREKSRPGEIWIKAVTAKERLLPPPVST